MTASKAREKLTTYGTKHMSDVEIYALALGVDESTARRVHDSHPIYSLSSVMSQELQEVDGISPASAARLAASVELGRRIAASRLPWREALVDPSAVAKYMIERLRGATQEHFVVLGLDARQRCRYEKVVGIGTLTQVEIHPRELFRPLIRAGAHACILVHNHPSGDPVPGDADIALTHRMKDIGKMVGIPVLDHIIVSDNSYRSFAEMGII